MLSDVCTMVHGVSIITPPDVTNKIIEEIIELGIQHVWMQPGAEHGPLPVRKKLGSIVMRAEPPAGSWVQGQLDPG